MKRPAVAALALTLFAVATAHARSVQSVPYPAPDLWATSIRFLRVDRGFPIREKDESAGYVLFDYLEGGRSYHGALELIAAPDVDGRAGAQLVVSIPDLPHRYETGLLDRLAAKIRDERGPPVPRRKTPDGAPTKPSGGESSKGEARDQNEPPSKQQEKPAPAPGGRPR
ncbi:MAG: hypothetical protein ABUS79_28280, partial [Pseudomonadota bacterium]